MKQRECSCTQEVKIHTHRHTLIAFTGTNAAQQPAQQQFPWSVTHTQRAPAEVWSPDVKDCLGQCGPGTGQTHTDGQICKTHIHRSRQTQTHAGYTITEK